MIEGTVHVKSRREAVRRVVANLPSLMRTNTADPIVTRCGAAILSRILRAFVVKARGGTDEAGEQWAPLSPRTLAYGRRAKRTATESKREERPSQGITKRQREQWWDVYRRQLQIHKGDKGHAAAVAWLVIKASGARTLLDKYGKRQVRDILGGEGGRVYAAIKLQSAERGVVTIGADDPVAAAHHSGVPRRLPQRRLWPAPAAWPASWWAVIMDAARRGLVDMAREAITRASK